MSSIFGSWGGDSSNNPPQRTQTASSPDRDQTDDPPFRSLFGGSGVVPSDPPPAHSQDGMNQDDVMSGAMPSTSGAMTEQPVMSGALRDTSKEPSATIAVDEEGSNPAPLPVVAEPGMEVVEEVVETVEAPIVDEPDREDLVKAPEPIIDSAPSAIQVVEETSTVINPTNGAPVIVETHAETIEEPTAAGSSDSDIPADGDGKRRTIGAATARAKAASTETPGSTIKATAVQPKRRGRPPKNPNSTPAASTKKATNASATPRPVGRPRKDGAAAPPGKARSADPPRKRGRPAKSATERTSVQRPVTARTAAPRVGKVDKNAASKSASQNTADGAPAPKRRGRPPKNIKSEAAPGDTSPAPKTQNSAASAAPAKRGRPRKADSKPAAKRGRPAAASKPQDTVVEGPKRRGRPPKATTSAALPTTTKRARAASPDPAPSAKKAKVEPAPAKRRGRPPKNAPKESEVKPAATNGDDGAAETATAKEEPKRRPGVAEGRRRPTRPLLRRKHL